MLIKIGSPFMLLATSMTLVSCGTAATSETTNDVAALAQPVQPKQRVWAPRTEQCGGAFENMLFHYPVQLSTNPPTDDAFWPEWQSERDRMRTKDEKIFRETIYNMIKIANELNDVASTGGDGKLIFRRILALKSDLLKYYDYENRGTLNFSQKFFMYEYIMATSALYSYTQTGDRNYIDLAYKSNVLGRNIIPKITKQVTRPALNYDEETIVAIDTNASFFALKAALDNNLLAANYLNNKIQRAHMGVMKQVASIYGRKWLTDKCDKGTNEFNAYRKLVLAYENYRFHPGPVKLEMIRKYSKSFSPSAAGYKYVSRIKKELSIQ